MVVWFSFFVAILVGAFRCFLGCCFGLCFRVVGGLAPELVFAWSFQFPLSYDFGCNFLHLMRHRMTARLS